MKVRVPGRNAVTRVSMLKESILNVINRSTLVFEDAVSILFDLFSKGR
jgi:hypothetical protein